MLLILLSLSPAHAQDVVDVTFNGVSYGVNVGTITRPDGSTLAASGGTMDLTIDGDAWDAYCVDLDNGISAGANYEAELVAMPSEDPWCAVNHIIASYGSPADNDEAAAVQVAIWKSIEPGLTVSNSGVDARADDIVDESAGICPLTCEDEIGLESDASGASDGLVTFELVVDRGDGDIPSGQDAYISTSAGSLVSPADGVGTLDDDGALTVVVDPEGATDLSLQLELDAQTLRRVEPTDTVQQLLGLIYDECTFDTDASWDAVEFGNPRTIGFWKHQFSVATGAKGGRQHVDTATLESFLPIDVFGTEYSTIDEAYSALVLKKASMAKRAQQQCLATSLNVGWGQLGWLTEVDIDGDGASDGQLFELWGDAQDAWDAGDYESAKTTCDTINNL